MVMHLLLSSLWLWLVRLLLCLRVSSQSEERAHEQIHQVGSLVVLYRVLWLDHWVRLRDWDAPLGCRSRRWSGPCPRMRHSCMLHSCFCLYSIDAV